MGKRKQGAASKEAQTARTVQDATKTAAQADQEVKETPVSEDMSTTISAEIEALMSEDATDLTVTTTEKTLDELKEELRTAEAAKQAPKPKTAVIPAHTLEGHCRCCGKPLTVVTSIHRGLGPVCYQQLSTALDMTAEDAAGHLKNDTDEEWATLVAQLREALRTNPESLDEPPTGFVKLAEVSKQCQAHNIPVSRWIKAFGGDRNVNEPEFPEAKPVYVGKTRYVHPEAFEILASKYATEAKRDLAGAAKAAREARAAKAASATPKSEAAALDAQLAELQEVGAA